jgi:hypothetical protein
MTGLAGWSRAIIYAFDYDLSLLIAAEWVRGQPRKHAKRTRQFVVHAVKPWRFRRSVTSVGWYKNHGKKYMVRLIGWVCQQHNRDLLFG